MSRSSRRTSLGLAAVPVALLTGAASLAAADREGGIVFRVTGQPDTSFTAECELTAADSTTTLSIKQTVPYQSRPAGSALRCRIAASAPIEVEISKNGNRSRTRSSGGVIVVSVGS